MQQFLITTVIMIFFSTMACSQLNYGVKLGITYGKYTNHQFGGTLVQNDNGLGVNIGSLIRYSIGSHLLQGQPSLQVIRSPYKERFKTGHLHDVERFFFIELPIIYSYRILDGLFIGAGINNSVLMESTSTTDPITGRKKILIGIQAEIEYALISNLRIALSHRYVGLFQTAEGYRTYSSLNFEFRWIF